MAREYGRMEYYRTNEVAVLKVEPVQLVARLLRIHYVLIDHERCAFGIRRDALPNLAEDDVG